MSHLTYLPNMLMREVAAAVATGMKPATGMDVPMLTHVVCRGVVLATHRADVPLLPGSERPQAVALRSLRRGRRGHNISLIDDVIGVVIGDIMVFSLELLGPFRHLGRLDDMIHR